MTAAIAAQPAAAPVVPTSGGAPEPTDSAAASGFAAMVAAALGQGPAAGEATAGQAGTPTPGAPSTGKQSGQPTDPAKTDAAKTDAAKTEDATPGTATVLDPTALALAPALAAAIAAPAVPATTTTPAGGTETRTVTSAGTGAVVGQVAAKVTGNVTAKVAGKVAGEPEVAAKKGDAPTAAADATPATKDLLPAAARATTTGRDQDRPQDQSQTASQNAAQTPAQTPVTVTGPTATNPTTPTTPTTPAHATHVVAGQVIPEVTRLVSRGDGVHRVTLELNPRALGEVKVVLTLRHGDVHVRLAAGSEARASLAQSSGELSRALEQLGIKDHRISLAALPGEAGVNAGPGDQSRQAQPDTNTDQSRQQNPAGGFHPEQQQQDHHSWKGADSLATEGALTHQRTGPTTVPVSTSSPTAPAAAGSVDVRM